MTAVHLHVGMPKCASTTLQRFFADNDQQHLAAGVCYPRSYREERGYRSHRPLHAAGIDGVMNAVDEMAREAERNDCHTVVISSEEFTNSLWDKEIFPRVVEALNERFGHRNVTLVFLLRNYFKFVESVYAQFLWGGMFRVPRNSFVGDRDSGIEEYVKAFRDTNGFDFFEYSKFLQFCQDVAPGNRIDVKSIERSDLGNDGLIGWLCTRYGLPRPDRVADANVRVDGARLRAMHHARARYRFAEVKDRRGVLRRTFTNDGPKSPALHLSERLVAPVREVVEREQQWFSQAGMPLSPAVTELPDGFPRDFSGDRPLTEHEVDAIRYIFEDDRPRPEVARAIMARETMR